MTSQGHSHAAFRRAVARRSLPAAWAAAAELRPLALDDALDLCLLVLDREPSRFDRAAARWHGRWCCECDVDLDEAAFALGLVRALRGRRARAAAHALGELFAARGENELAAALRRWETENAS